MRDQCEPAANFDALGWAAGAGWSPASQRYFGRRSGQVAQRFVVAITLTVLLVAMRLAMLTFRMRQTLMPPSTPAVDPCGDVDTRAARQISELVFGKRHHPIRPDTRFEQDLKADKVDSRELQGAPIDEFSLPVDTVLAGAATVDQLTDRLKQLNHCRATSP